MPFGSKEKEINKASLRFVAKFWWMVAIHYLSLTFVHNRLIWDRAILISILIISYDIDFVRWIHAEIHKTIFCKFTTFSFPFLVQILCDAAIVMTIHKVYQRVEATCMVNIILTKDASNTIALHKAHLSIFSNVAFFKEPTVLAKYFDRATPVCDMDTTSHQESLRLLQEVRRLHKL